jgi:hypothetical protein
MAQPKGFGMVAEREVKAFRGTATSLDERYGQIWAKALREKIQSDKA